MKLIDYILGAPPWFCAFASHSHVMMTKMQGGTIVTNQNSVTANSIENERDLRRRLMTAPIKIPLRTKRDVIEANKKLEDPKTMDKMANLIASVIAYVTRTGFKKTTSSLISNAIVCRFDLVCFIVKRLTNCREQEGLEPGDFINTTTCLPLVLCAGISRLFENSMRAAGELDCRYWRIYSRFCY